MNAPSNLVAAAHALVDQLRLGMLLTRPQTRSLLNKLTQLESNVPGCVVMCAQLRSALQRRDWVTISVEVDLNTIATSGVTIGIVESKPVKTKTRLTPMQRWQRRNGLGLRRGQYD